MDLFCILMEDLRQTAIVKADIYEQGLLEESEYVPGEFGETSLFKL